MLPRRRKCMHHITFVFFHLNSKAVSLLVDFVFINIALLCKYNCFFKKKMN